ncbi:hypothetical protein CARUB_v10022449mg [Capsella rubella]|uniref:Bifunctional inhibitor/plant lipid transfer protein/seed storage helical domain-containing protein n=1 Tax=Capsella rubella TaxID=81985 RepID=R0GG82_9BRAS|nr:hypothetical protein CARUB_v10022449mg [Capsella rubella]
MEIIPLMFIILLSSFRVPVKVAGKGASHGGGGGFVGSGSGSIGIGKGYRGGNIGTGGSIRDGSSVGTGYRGGGSNGKPGGGGDPGAAIVVFPKKPEEPKKKAPPPLPQECKPEVRDCINAHMYGGAGAPERGAQCCATLRKSVPCVCKFLRSHDPKLSKGANDVLRGCHYNRTKCSKKLHQFTYIRRPRETSTRRGML